MAQGIYSEKGKIAVRLYSFENPERSIDWDQKLSETLEKRKSLFSETDSVRLIHGENDSIPGITMDLHGNHLSVQVYSRSLVALARLLSHKITKMLNPSPTTVYLQSGTRIGEEESRIHPRWLQGEKIDSIPIHFRNIPFWIRIEDQKGGGFNDVRSIRRNILEHPEYFKNQTALHLFCHNGLSSICMEKAGAHKVLSVDSSSKAIRTFQENLEKYPDSEKHTVLNLDLFRDLDSVWEYQTTPFGVILLDPPNLTPNQKSKPNAIRTYQYLLKECIQHLKVNGTLFFSSCSNRVSKEELLGLVQRSANLVSARLKLIQDLPTEVDHPVSVHFPEGKYFKAFVYKRVS